MQRLSLRVRDLQDRARPSHRHHVLLYKTEEQARRQHPRARWHELGGVFAHEGRLWLLLYFEKYYFVDVRRPRVWRGDNVPCVPGTEVCWGYLKHVEGN